MRILFMGTPEFAVPSLRVLMDNYEVVAVVTAPDKPRGRGQNVSFTHVKEFALSRNLKTIQPADLKDQSFIGEVTKLDPDLIVVVAFRILPKEIYTIPKLGSFNLHASLLPKYRGAAPINWAIINGEKESGVTTFFLQEKVDTGALILQSKINIGPEETAGELQDKLSEIGAGTVLQTVRLIENGKVQTSPQDDSYATPAPKIFKEDCRIDWSKPAQQVHNFVRGLSPGPAAWTKHKGKIIKIFRTKLSGMQKGRGGLIIKKTDDDLLIGTGDGGAVSIVEIQQEGKRRLRIEEFLRGYPVKEGEFFE